MMQHPEMRGKVKGIQKDKYPEGRVPVATVVEESFVEYFQEVVTDGEIRSRLGENDKAVELVRDLLR